MKKYYKERKDDIDNDRPYAYCRLPIDWYPKDFIDDECLDGYIVQKVKINNVGIDIEDRYYYEAWKIENGRYVEHTESKADDTFGIGSFSFINIWLSKSIGKNGYTTFLAEVYWISKNNKLYEVVEKWKEKTVPEAGELKSILVEDCPELKDCIPVLKRPEFKHKVSFTDREVIQKEIEEIYSERIKRKEKELYDDLQELLGNTEYSDIIDSICGDWNIML